MKPTSLRSWVCVRYEAARALVYNGVLLAPLGGLPRVLGCSMRPVTIKERLSYVPIKIESFFDDTQLSCGTGFFYEYGTTTYLLTNWHMVSGRNTSNGQPLSRTGAIPNKMHIRIPYKEKIDENRSGIRWKQHILDLYEESIPIWFVHPKHNENIDVIGIELSGIEETSIIPANSTTLDLENISIYPSMEVFILGFPLGMSGGGNFPLWKRGTIASEPEIDIDNLPKFFVDTATREGMSGSPVYAQEVGYWAPEGVMDKKDWYIGKGRRFVGVYSGRIGAEDEFKAQLGIVWKASCIDAILEKKIRGKSSFSFFERAI